MTDPSKNLVELEMRISVMEKSFDDLSDMVTKQWQMMEQLKRKISALESQLESKQDRSDSGGYEPPPPHY